MFYTCFICLVLSHYYGQQGVRKLDSTQLMLDLDFMKCLSQNNFATTLNEKMKSFIKLIENEKEGKRKQIRY